MSLSALWAAVQYGESCSDGYDSQRDDISNIPHRLISVIWHYCISFLRLISSDSFILSWESKRTCSTTKWTHDWGALGSLDHYNNEDLPEGYIAQRLADSQFVVAASPDYLIKAGTPHVPSDLIDHNRSIYRSRERDYTSWAFDNGQENPVLKWRVITGGFSGSGTRRGSIGLGCCLSGDLLSQRRV